MYALNSLERGLRPGCIGSAWLVRGSGMGQGWGVSIWGRVGQEAGGWPLRPQPPMANSLPYLGGPTSAPRSPCGLQQS